MLQRTKFYFMEYKKLCSPNSNILTLSYVNCFNIFTVRITVRKLCYSKTNKVIQNTLNEYIENKNHLLLFLII